MFDVTFSAKITLYIIEDIERGGILKKTIFSKHYDRDKELEIPEGSQEPELDSFEEFWKKCQEAVVVPVPARLEGAKVFIQKIMDFCELFSYDIEIEQLNREIQAKMKIDVLTLSGYCKNEFVSLMQMADDLSLYKNQEGDTVFTFSYYTHEIYFEGKPSRNLQ